MGLQVGERQLFHGIADARQFRLNGFVTSDGTGEEGLISLGIGPAQDFIEHGIFRLQQLRILGLQFRGDVGAGFEQFAGFRLMRA